MNYTIRGREVTTSWKLGGVEMWFGGEKDWGCWRREGALVTEKSERERSSQVITQGKHFPKPLS